MNRKPILMTAAVVAALALTGCSSGGSVAKPGGAAKPAPGAAVFDFGETPITDVTTSNSWVVQLPASLLSAMGAEADGLLFTTAVVKSEPVQSNNMCAVRITPDYKDFEAATQLLKAEPLTREEAEVVAAESYDDYFDRSLMWLADGTTTTEWAPAAETKEQFVAALEAGPSPQEDPLKYWDALGSFTRNSDELTIQQRTLYFAANQSCHAQFGHGDFGSGEYIDGKHYDCGRQLTEESITMRDPEGSGYISMVVSGGLSVENGIIQLIGEDGVNQAFTSTGLIPATWTEAFENFSTASRAEYIAKAMNEWDHTGQDIYSKHDAKPGVAAARILGLRSQSVAPMAEFDSANPKQGTYLADDFSEAIEVVPCAQSAYDTEGAATLGFRLVASTTTTYDGARWTTSELYTPVAGVELPTMLDGSITVGGEVDGWTLDANGSWLNRD